MKTFQAVLFSVLMICMGCASPDMVSTKKNGGEKYSADDVRRMTVDQPFLITGDYFRERNQQPYDIFGKSGTETAKAVPAPPKSEPVAEPRQSSPIMPIKIGLLSDSQNISIHAAARIRSAVPESAKDFPVLMVEEETMSEVLRNTECLKTKDLLCASRKLGLYPGVRMLVMFERFVIPEIFPGNAEARFTITDTAIGFRYPVTEFGKTVGQKEELTAVIREILDNVFAFAVRKSEIMPPFCRTFSSENGKSYITAGKLSGLKPGDMLEILAPGQLVKSPAGTPAGWIPGKRKGMVRVETLFGKDMAVCSPTEGEAPTPEDMLGFFR